MVRFQKKRLAIKYSNWRHLLPFSPLFRLLSNIISYHESLQEMYYHNVDNNGNDNVNCKNYQVKCSYVISLILLLFAVGESVKKAAAAPITTIPNNTTKINETSSNNPMNEITSAAK